MALFFQKNNTVKELNQNNHINTTDNTISQDDDDYRNNLKITTNNTISQDDDDHWNNLKNTKHDTISQDDDDYIYETESQELSKY